MIQNPGWFATIRLADQELPRFRGIGKRHSPYVGNLCVCGATDRYSNAPLQDVFAPIQTSRFGTRYPTHPCEFNTDNTAVDSENDV